MKSLDGLTWNYPIEILSVRVIHVFWIIRQGRHTWYRRYHFSHRTNVFLYFKAYSSLNSKYFVSNTRIYYTGCGISSVQYRKNYFSTMSQHFSLKIHTYTHHSVQLFGNQISFTCISNSLCNNDVIPCHTTSTKLIRTLSESSAMCQFTRLFQWFI